MIKVALVDTTIEIRLLKISELAKLLDSSPEKLLEWYLVEMQAPMDSSVHRDKSPIPPLHRLAAMLRVEKTDLWQVILLAIAAGILSLATPAAVQSLVNTVALGGMLQPLLILSLMLLIFLVFFGCVSVLQSYIVELIQRRIFVRMASDVAFRLPRAQSNAFGHVNGGELVNRFFDVLTVQKSGAFLLLEGFSMALQSVIGLLVLAAYHPYLMLFDLLVIGWLAFIIRIQGRRGVDTAIDESTAKYAIVAWLQSLARNGQTFKFKGGPEFARERADKLAYDYLNARKRHYRILLNQHISVYALYAVAGTALLAVGGILVMEGQLSLGQLVASELIVSVMLLTFAKFKKQLESYYDLLAGVNKLGYLLDLPIERESGETVTFDKPVALAVYGIHFNYDEGIELFDDLGFSVDAGKKIAILGPSGCGKSTLANLLAGLRSPNKGRIELNGLDLRELSLEQLRRELAIVGPAEIIEDTLLENVRLRRPEVTVRAAEEALNRLGLKPKHGSAADTLYTLLNSEGAPLPSSCIPKLLLARAMLGNPKLLIIDGVLDDWPHFVNSDAREMLFGANANWTLVVLTRSPEIARICEHTIELGDNREQ